MLFPEEGSLQWHDHGEIWYRLLKVEWGKLAEMWLYQILPQSHFLVQFVHAFDT